MKALTRTRKVGGSLVVTLPNEIVKSETLEENELIELEIKKHKRSFFGALKGIGPFTKKDKLRGQLEE